MEQPCAPKLGTMRVTEQIDALRSMAVDPLRYLVAPRLYRRNHYVAGPYCFSSIMGIIGGFVIAVHDFMAWRQNTFLDPLPIHITPSIWQAESSKRLCLE